MKKGWIIGISVIIVMGILAVAGIFAYRYFSPFLWERTYEPVAYTETSGDAGGPFRGFYRIYAYGASDSLKPDKEWIKKELNDNKDQTLVLCEVNLNAYRNGDISETGLKNIEDFLDIFIDSNKTLIVRFLYDWSGLDTIANEEPEDISIIKRHMEQIAPIINKRKAAILTHQGIFAGKYAEMHSSKYTSDKNVKQLFETLDGFCDDDIYLSVRTPRFYRLLTGIQNTVDLEKLSHDASKIYNRVALFNDGMLGSSNDVGTYGDGNFSENQGAVAVCREDEIGFQDSLCKYVPNGGEVIIDNKYNDMPAAAETLKNIHVSYLNSEYDTQVFEKWEKSSYEQYDSSYDYIQSHMGYRFLVKDSYVVTEAFSDQKEKFYVIISNTGFAPYYKNSSISLRLVGDNGIEKDITTDINPENISLTEDTVIEFEFDKRELLQGEYHLFIHLKDEGLGASIPLANAGYSNGEDFELGTYKVEGMKLFGK
ncbi:MAG: DUF4832 domain-containing protein [Lachnospiraceae bacterium]|nr:DUF4832 domain-containing protein [Lachnospiraceae bacterium]